MEDQDLHDQGCTHNAGCQGYISCDGNDDDEDHQGAESHTPVKAQHDGSGGCDSLSSFKIHKEGVVMAQHYRKTGNPTRTITTASGQVKDGDAETAVIFELEGTLKPGSKVTVTFKAQVNDAAILYGKTMENYTFLSSSKHSYHIAGVNPYGYSFHNDVGQFPPTLPTAAANLDDGAAVREGGLHTVLGDYADADTPFTIGMTIYGKDDQILEQTVFSLNNKKNLFIFDEYIITF